MSTKLRDLVTKGLVLSAFAVWAGSAMAAEFTMKISESRAEMPDDVIHFFQTPLKEFAKEVNEASGGRIEAKIYWGGQLGKIENVVNLVRGGQVEAVSASDGHVAPYFPDVQILGLPYLFVNRQVANEVLDGPAGQLLNDRMAEQVGLRPMPWLENGGYRHYSSSKPMSKLEDMAGLKIRTMSNPVHMEIVRSLGASPTPIPWGDLYTSLQTGVVDGQENSLSVFRLPKLEEVQKNIILDGHVYSMLGLFISQKWLDTLPDDLKAVVENAALNFKESNRKLSIDAERMDREYLEGAGVSIVDLSLEEKARFKEAAQGPALELIKGEVDPDVLDAFLNAVKDAEAKL